MATAKYPSATVASAARQRLVALRRNKTVAIEALTRDYERRVVRKMKPKWWRPWALSRKRAERAVRRQDMGFSAAYHRPFSLYRDIARIGHEERDIRRLLALAESTDGHVSLDVREVHLLFLPPSTTSQTPKS